MKRKHVQPQTFNPFQVGGIIFIPLSWNSNLTNDTGIFLIKFSFPNAREGKQIYLFSNQFISKFC